MVIVGGCLCGAVRYESQAMPVETGYCHCSICRGSTGAPAVAYASFPLEQFRYTQGEVSVYPSSATGQREFCATCGTQLCHRGVHNPTTVDINSGTLDDINAMPPQCHIYTAESVSWLRIDDALPRYPAGPE